MGGLSGPPHLAAPPDGGGFGGGYGGAFGGGGEGAAEGYRGERLGEQLPFGARGGGASPLNFQPNAGPASKTKVCRFYLGRNNNHFGRTCSFLHPCRNLLIEGACRHGKCVGGGAGVSGRTVGGARGGERGATASRI